MLDDMHLLARFDILQHCARSIQHRHQCRRRDYPYLLLHGVIDHIGLISMDFGKNRLRRDKHHRAITCFGWNNIFDWQCHPHVVSRRP